MTAYATIDPSESYSLEFSSSNNKDLYSLVALDNIFLYPYRFCQVLKCSFSDANCGENLFPYQELPDGVWNIKNLLGNFYLNADLTNVKAGKKSFYGFPVVKPLYEKMCIRFQYLIKVFAHVRVLMVKGRTNLKAIWHQTAESKNILEKQNFKNHLIFLIKIGETWEEATIDVIETDSFQLVIEIYKINDQNSLSSNLIGFDAFEVLYGSCNKMKNKR